MSEQVSILGYHPVPRSTKAEQFLGKIHGLTDFYICLKEKSGSLPSGKEVANYLKYFQDQFLSWLRDIQPQFYEETREFNYSEFPTVDYHSLYQTLLLLLQVCKNVEADVKEYADAVLKTFTCLIPFLETEILLNTPVQLVSCLADLPPSTHSTLVTILCSYIIPLTYGCMAPKKFIDREWVLASTGTILLSTLQFCEEPGLWMKTIECLMAYSDNVRSHILCVLAYGAQETSKRAFNLLDRYFPPVDIGSLKANQAAPYDVAPSYKCQSISCPSNNSVNASKVCLDPGFCAEALNTPPPVYFCVLCVQTYCIADSPLCLDIIYPFGAFTDVCEYLKCRGSEKKATHFCFDPDCITKNQFRPMRLCTTCFIRLHEPGTDGENHITHQCLDDLWLMSNPEQTYLVDAIKKLLQVAQPIYKQKCMEMGVQYEIHADKENSLLDKRVYFDQISSSFHGLRLLRSLCHLPPSAYHFEHLGRLLAMLFSWTEAVAYFKNPEIIQTLKEVQEQANSWGQQVMAFDVDLYCNCLLPVPPLYARVGYPWEALMSKVHQLLEGLQKLSTLLKFGLVPDQIWERIMPLWLQEIKEFVPVDEMTKFSTILRKFFEPENEVYSPYALNFIGKRLNSIVFRQKQEALVWIQMLSSLNIKLDHEKLLEMFGSFTVELSQREGNTASVFPFPDVDILQTVSMSSGGPTPGTPVSLPLLTSVTDGLTFYILVMDIIIKQMSIRDKIGSRLELSEQNSLMHLLIKLLEESWGGEHSNHLTEECQQCRITGIFFYEIHFLLEILIPNKIERNQTKDIQRRDGVLRNDSGKGGVFGDEDNTNETGDTDIAEVECLIENAFRPITRSLESLGSEDNPSNGSIEDWRESVFRHTEKFSRPSQGGTFSITSGGCGSSFPSLFSTHPQLRIIEGLLKELQKQQDSAAIQHILNGLSVLLIRGNYLRVIKGENLEYLYRLQNIFLIPSLWNLLESSNSHLAQSAVPLLICCMSHAFGAERVLDEIESMFDNANWKIRFAAVEKIALICQFMGTSSIFESYVAQVTVVICFIYLVSAAEDVNATVSNKARILLTSMKSASLNCLYKCLKLQFSQEPGDRLKILRTFKTIDELMPDSSPFCGQFFLNLLKDVDVDPRFGSIVADLMRSGSESASSDNDGINRGSVRSKSSTSPARSNSAASLIRGNFSRSNSNLMPSYRMKYTLQFDKYKSPVAAINSYSDDDDMLYRKRRQGTYIHGGPMQKMPQDGFLLGGKIIAGLDTVAEESDTVLKRSSVSSTSSSVLSGQSEKSCTQQGQEKEVYYQLIVILLRFLANKKRCKEEKEFGLTSEKDIVSLSDHLGTLMGFKESFTINPNELRQSTIFQSFLSTIVELLDSNDKMAEKFLPLCLAVMSYCLKENRDSELAQQTLARISRHLQYSWLMTLLVFLYKYDIKTYEKDVKDLVMTVVNTLTSSSHDLCKLKSTSSCLFNGASTHTKEDRKKARGYKTFQKISKFKAVKKHDKRYAPLVKTDSPGPSAEVIELTDMSGNLSMSSTTQTGVTPLSEQIVPDRISSMLLSTITAKLKEEDKSFTDVQICTKCNLSVVQYGEEIMNLCIVVLSTFVYRAPILAAPMLMDIFNAVGRKAVHGIYLWERNATVSGSCSGIARQFFRCTLLQLASKGVFPETFRSRKLEKAFFEGVALSLKDFAELNEMKPLEYLFSDFTSRPDPGDRLLVMFRNLFYYLQSLPKEPMSLWKSNMQHFESFFKHLASELTVGEDMTSLMKIMTLLTGLARNLFKTLLPYFSQILNHIIRKCVFQLKDLHQLCSVCIDSFSKERDKLVLTRTVLQETAMCMKMRHTIPESNLKQLFQFLMLDGKSWFAFDSQCSPSYISQLHKMKTVVMTLLQAYNTDAVDFLKTWKFKFKGSKDSPVDEDTSQIKTFPVQVKTAVGQLVALKLKDQIGASKVQGRVLAWVRVSQQGGQHGRGDHIPEIISHMRVLSWVLLGAVNHSVDTPFNPPTIYCIRINDTARIAEYVEVIILSYLVVEEQSRTSKKKSLAPLYFAFLLCEIWTVYCESLFIQRAHPEGNPISALVGFWGKVTFVILQLLRRAKGALGMKSVSLFVSTLESLFGCSRLIFSQFSSVWTQILEAYKAIVPSSTIRKLREFQYFCIDREEKKGFIKDWITRTSGNLASVEQMGRRPLDISAIV